MNIWLIASVMGSWFLLMWAFIAVMHCKHIMETENLTTFWKVHVLPLAVVGLLLDAAMNFTIGWLMFRELPWDSDSLLFSSRVQYHIDHSHGWRFDLAQWWAKNLNQIDPRHIRRV